MVCRSELLLRRDRLAADLNLQGKRRDEATPSDHATVEPGTALTQRLMSFWDERLKALASSEQSDQPRKILLVSHGGAIRHLIEDLAVRRGSSYVMDLPSGESLDQVIGKRIGNCCITEIHVEQSDDGWLGRFVKYADESHFIESSRAPSPANNVDVID